MRAAKRSNEQLLDWVTRIIAREQSEKAFGVISISMQGGIIERIETKMIEKPEDEEAENATEARTAVAGVGADTSPPNDARTGRDHIRSLPSKR
jgi:hypothetical protein